MKETQKNKVCCLCGKEFKGYGNNPEPIKSSKTGKCCDKCNQERVIPARLLQFYR